MLFLLVALRGFFTLINRLAVEENKKFNELVALVQTFEQDFEKFYVKGNKAAGVRVRKAMNELKKKAQDIRVEVQNMKTAEKTD